MGLHGLLTAPAAITVSGATALLTLSVLERLFFAFPDFAEVLEVALNYPQKPLGLADLLALDLEPLLVGHALLRPSLLEFLKPPLAALEETDCSPRESVRGAVGWPTVSSARCARRETGPGASDAIPRSPRRFWQLGRPPIRWS